MLRTILALSVFIVMHALAGCGGSSSVPPSEPEMLTAEQVLEDPQQQEAIMQAQVQ